MFGRNEILYFWNVQRKSFDMARTAKTVSSAALLLILDLESELGAEMAALIEERQSIIATIKKLPAREYRLIRLMYVGTVARSGEIVYMSLKQTAADMGISRRTATGIHGSALDRLRKILKEDNSGY